MVLWRRSMWSLMAQGWPAVWLLTFCLTCRVILSLLLNQNSHPALLWKLHQQNPVFSFLFFPKDRCKCHVDASVRNQAKRHLMRTTMTWIAILRTVHQSVYTVTHEKIKCTLWAIITVDTFFEYHHLLSKNYFISYNLTLLCSFSITGIINDTFEICCESCQSILQGALVRSTHFF